VAQDVAEAAKRTDAGARLDPGSDLLDGVALKRKPEVIRGNASHGLPEKPIEMPAEELGHE